MLSLVELRHYCALIGRELYIPSDEIFSLLALIVKTEGDSWRQVCLRLGSGVEPHHHLGGKELSQAGQEHQIEERRLGKQIY